MKVQIYSATNPLELQESINLFIKEIGDWHFKDIKFAFCLTEKGGIFTAMILYTPSRKAIKKEAE